MSEQLLTIDQLAEQLQVSKKTIYDWNYRGVGPRRIKVGRGCRWHPRDVAAWQSKRQVKA